MGTLHGLRFLVDFREMKDGALPISATGSPLRNDVPPTADVNGQRWTNGIGTLGGSGVVPIFDASLYDEMFPAPVVRDGALIRPDGLSEQADLVLGFDVSVVPADPIPLVEGIENAMVAPACASVGLDNFIAGEVSTTGDQASVTAVYVTDWDYSLNGLGAASVYVTVDGATPFVVTVEGDHVGDDSHLPGVVDEVNDQLTGSGATAVCYEDGNHNAWYIKSDTEGPTSTLEVTPVEGSEGSTWETHLKLVGSSTSYDNGGIRKPYAQVLFADGRFRGYGIRAVLSDGGSDTRIQLLRQFDDSPFVIVLSDHPVGRRLGRGDVFSFEVPAGEPAGTYNSYLNGELLDTVFEAEDPEDEGTFKQADAIIVALQIGRFPMNGWKPGIAWFAYTDTVPTTRPFVSIADPTSNGLRDEASIYSAIYALR